MWGFSELSITKFSLLHMKMKAQATLMSSITNMDNFTSQLGEEITDPAEGLNLDTSFPSLASKTEH